MTDEQLKRLEYWAREAPRAIQRLQFRAAIAAELARRQRQAEATRAAIRAAKAEHEEEQAE